MVIIISLKKNNQIFADLGQWKHDFLKNLMIAWLELMQQFKSNFFFVACLL